MNKAVNEAASPGSRRGDISFVRDRTPFCVTRLKAKWRRKGGCVRGTYHIGKAKCSLCSYASPLLLLGYVTVARIMPYTMPDVIQISVDGQDGALVARSHGLGLVPPNLNLALVRVRLLEFYLCSLFMKIQSFPFVL